jgi:hypothetical protein
MYFPGQYVITDVVVSHALSPGYINNRLAFRTLAVAKHREQRKHSKYDQTAKRLGGKLLPFAVETCGGLGPDAQRLLEVIGEAGEEHLSMWTKETTTRHLQDTVAVAIQRGGAMMYQHLHSLLLWQEVLSRKEKHTEWREKGNDYNLWRGGVTA